VTRASITRKINVVEQGDTPAAGTAMNIAAAGGHQAVRNTGVHTEGYWTKALFEAYGSGTFNPDYSTDGAFVIASSGGHNHAEVRGAAGFDFTSRTWFYVAPVGVSETSSYTHGIIDDPHGITDTNGAPWHELIGTEVPAPPHPYRHMTYIPTSNGGGTKGSIMHLGRAAIGEVGDLGSAAAHKFNCATGVWARAAATVGSFPLGAVESTAIFDTVANRYYLMSGDLHNYSFVRYLDGSNWTWNTTTPAYPWPGVGDTQYTSSVLYQGNGKRLLIQFWGSRMHALDLSDVVSGFQNLAYTGTLADPQAQSSWVQHIDGNLYARDSTGAGQVLRKITPPANPISGNWTVGTVTLTGDTIPEFIGLNASTNCYQSLFYIPTLQVLGWVTAFGVSLLNPP
jgi:hypothetical protein